MKPPLKSSQTGTAGAALPTLGLFSVLLLVYSPDLLEPTRLARALIAGEVGEGTDITFTVENDQLAPIQSASAAKK